MDVKPIILSIFFAVLVVQAVYSGYYFLAASRMNKEKLVINGKFGDDKKPPFKLFISGDSIAVGVGASDFNTSLAGRIVDYLSKDKHVVFENAAISGARMQDLVNMSKPREKQDLIILIISSNDVFYLTNTVDFRAQTDEVIESYLKYSDKLVIVGPGRLFESGVLPVPVRTYYKYISPQYVKILKNAAERHKGTIYLNPTDKSVDVKGYGRTAAKDKFHPNDNGYKLWFDIINPVLK